MVFRISAKKRKARKVSKFAEDIIIKKEVAKEKAKLKVLKFEERKKRAIQRARNPLSRRFRGVAVKAGKRAGKDIGKSLRGFAQKVGKPRESEKETLVVLGGRSRRVKGRVRIVQPADSALDIGDLGLGLGLNDKPVKKQKRLKPFRFF